MAKKNKTYVFNEMGCKDLNELGINYSKSFRLAIDDIFTNTKKLLKFVKYNDKKLVKDVVSIITDCKYKNNVATFLIYLFCNDKRVVINGEALSFKGLVYRLRVNGENHKAIYAFMEDLGISKTYANEKIDPYLYADAYYIEKNIHDPFTYEYLTTYFEFDYVESLRSFISNIFISDEERFRRAVKIVKNPRFCMILAHKVGFKSVFQMRNANCPIFDAIKNLVCEFDEIELYKIVSDTFFFWLLENFDKYTYKKTAKKIFKELVALKKLYEKQKKNSTFFERIDLASNLYDCYINFVIEFKNGNISVKKKYDDQAFTPDKPYCNTFITIDYMKNHTVKLKSSNFEKNNDLDDYPLENDSIEEAEASDEIIIKKHISEKELLMQEKFLRKQRGFSKFSIFTSCLFLIFLLAYKLIEMIMNNEALRNVLDNTSFIVFISVSLSSTAISLFLLILASLGINNCDNCLFIVRSERQEIKLTRKIELKYSKMKENEDIYYKKGMKKNYIFSIITSILLSSVSCMMAVFVILILSKLNIMFLDIDTKNKILLYPIGIAFGLIYSIILKKKGVLSSILLFIIGFLSAFVMALVI